MKCPEWTDSQKQKVDSWLSGAGRREKLEGTGNRCRLALWVGGNVTELDSGDEMMAA